MIRVENLVKNYGPVEAVRSINFTAKDGEILGFLGANGAGKTTTMKVMTGFLSPTSGNVFINDLNIIDDSLEIRKQIGYLPELNPLYQDMNVHDLLEFTAQIRQIEGKEFRKALTRVISQCGLDGVVHRLVSECSKGYRQRIGLACAIIHDPEILILDEPVTGLDPNQIVEIRKLIKELGKEKTVIISSHILQEIEATVDRMIIINQGEIVADGTPKDLMSEFSGNTKLTLEILNYDSEKHSGLLKSIEGVHVHDVNDEAGKAVFHIEYEKNADPRKDIFQLAVKSNWIITEMSPHKAHLEEMFHKLTVQEGTNV